MSTKIIPFDLSKAESLLSEYGSPLYVYDESGIKATVRELHKAFEGVRGYKNYFAVKATPTPGILKLLAETGMGFDCSSRAELLMAKRLGVPGGDIFFTSNNTTKEDFELAVELGAIVNIDDLTQIPVFLEVLNGGGYEHAAVRFNPGDAQTGNFIIGEPKEAKYGMRLDQLHEAYDQLARAGIRRFGLHTMVASNERDADYFAITAKLLAEAIKDIEYSTGVKVSFLNLGGGFGIPYRPQDDPLNLAQVVSGIKRELDGFDGDIYTENGRFVTGPNGYLLTRVRYVMEKYKTYIGVDASMHNLMRPGMYGAYHHISVLGRKGDAGVYDVVGSLCENNDKFAIDRSLPGVRQGDILVIHDAGAHGHAMGFNYNGLLRSAEVMLNEDGSCKLMRRAEAIEDYFATLVW